MTRILVLFLPLLLLSPACGRAKKSADGAAGKAKPPRTAAPLPWPRPTTEGMKLVGDIENPASLSKLLELGDVGALLKATEKTEPQPTRRLACYALGKVGGPAARTRLLELVDAKPGNNPSAEEVTNNGWIRLYAAVGLTELHDPATAIDLLEVLSTINPEPSNALANRASETTGEGVEYFTIDAQLCDALLGLGVWNVEDSLIEQMHRHDKIRVAIDAYGVLRRRSGVKMTYLYNASWEERQGQADAIGKHLVETRATREKAQPFRGMDLPHFKEKLAEVMKWLGGMSARQRVEAERVLTYLGPNAVPALIEGLAGKNSVRRREAAFVLAQIGPRQAKAAIPALRKGLQDPDADARSKAIDALCALRDEGSRSEVAARLHDDDAGVRSAAAAYLGAMGNQSDVAALQAALEAEGVPGTRTTIVCALYRLGAPEARKQLLDILVNGEIVDRRAALKALRQKQPNIQFNPDAPKKERDRQARAFK